MDTISGEQVLKALEPTPWDYGNSVLYQMCEKTPYHRDESEIIGKLWLIGRSYAAAIERGSKGIHTGDDLYVKDVAPKMKDIGGLIDKRIELLRAGDIINEKTLVDIIEIHGLLVQILYDATGHRLRSFASKYLHFHAPNSFYIYDSRVAYAIRRYTAPNHRYKSIIDLKRCDLEYTKFADSMLDLNLFIHKQFGKWLTPRQMDILLLHYPQ